MIFQNASNFIKIAAICCFTFFSSHLLASGKEDVSALSAKDLAARIQQEFQDHKDLLGISEGKDVVVFLGNTGSGKSTLINYLVGNHLISDDEETYVLRNPNEPGVFPIGGTSSSVTKYPQLVEKDGLLLCDLPGFRDTEGTVANLVNAAFIKDILSRANSLLLVYVSKRDTIYADGRGQLIDQGVDAVRRLFQQNPDALENYGLFVLTASQKSEPAEAVATILKIMCTSKGPLYEILDHWDKKGKKERHFHHMQAPGKTGADRNNSIQEVGSATNQSILTSLNEMKGFQPRGINIDALYRKKDHAKLQKLFEHVMEVIWPKQVGIEPSSLSAIDERVSVWSHTNFWAETFDALVKTDSSVNLIQRFATNAYNEALNTFRKNKDLARQKHVESLKAQRADRVKEIEEATQKKAQRVVSAAQQPQGQQPQGQTQSDYIPFDFGYHQSFYEQVCGAANIGELTHDPLEQEVVRKHYAGFIAQHSHEQVMKWHKKFSGQDDVLRRLATLEGTVSDLQGTVSKILVPVGGRTLVIPKIAHNHINAYSRFVSAKLVYRPNPDSDKSLIELPVASITNPLSGVFDISGCGDASQKATFHVGFPTNLESDDSNQLKVWFAPRFWVETNINSSASYLRTVFNEWPVENEAVIFWTWGKWVHPRSALNDFYCYFISQSKENKTYNLSNVLEQLYAGQSYYGLRYSHPVWNTQKLSGTLRGVITNWSNPLTNFVGEESLNNFTFIM